MPDNDNTSGHLVQSQRDGPQCLVQIGVHARATRTEQLWGDESHHSLAAELLHGETPRGLLPPQGSPTARNGRSDCAGLPLPSNAATGLHHEPAVARGSGDTDRVATP